MGDRTNLVDYQPPASQDSQHDLHGVACTRIQAWFFFFRCDFGGNTVGRDYICLNFEFQNSLG